MKRSTPGDSNAQRVRVPLRENRLAKSKQLAQSTSNPNKFADDPFADEFAPDDDDDDLVAVSLSQ